MRRGAQEPNRGRIRITDDAWCSLLDSEAHSEPGDAVNPESDGSADCDPSAGAGSPFKINAD